MQLVIKNGVVIATHDDSQNISSLYQDCEIVFVEENIAIEYGVTIDPRNEEEKKKSYRDKRRCVYPSFGDQLDMIYHDIVDGTSTWIDAIAKIKNKFPKV